MEPINTRIFPYTQGATWVHTWHQYKCVGMLAGVMLSVQGYYKARGWHAGGETNVHMRAQGYISIMHVFLPKNKQLAGCHNHNLAKMAYRMHKNKLTHCQT